jgi:outer membrane murein-binding lipoprotein Lpp
MEAAAGGASMTAAGGLEEALLLRLVDRLVSAEQQIATGLASVGNLSETVGDLRTKIAALSVEVDEMRKQSTATMQSFEQMRTPLQSLLDLKQKLSGGYLVVVALFMAAAYLLQPLLSDLYSSHFGLK